MYLITSGHDRLNLCDNFEKLQNKRGKKKKKKPHQLALNEIRAVESRWPNVKILKFIPTALFYSETTPLWYP